MAAYKEQDDAYLIEDVHRRKEFAQLWTPEETIVDLRESHIMAQRHQQFVRNFSGPNTPFTRNHLMHSTGSGKTRAAIMTAQEYVRMFRYIYRGVNWRDQSVITPSIFIIGFGGKQSFMHDLIKYPEFGYASSIEFETYLRLSRESVESDDAYKKFSEFYAMLKRRTTNRAHGGFYKMIGYEEFTNRLFGSDAPKINTIIQEAYSKHVLWTNLLDEAITRGDIRVDTSLLARLENSMIIADEIHNTYNAQAINNRGVAIQYVLDHVRGVRFLSLSATPINSSPVEICDFINYFVEPAQKVRRSDLFNGHELLPGAMNKINDMLRGHISFLYDYNPRYFPKRIDIGIPMQVVMTRDDKSVIEQLPYLKFKTVEMSPMFVNTIKAYYAAAAAAATIANTGETSSEEYDYDEDVIGITQNAYSLFDMAFPNPSSETVGLYNSGSLFGMLHSASEKWKQENGVMTKVVGGNHIINGKFLRVPTLAKYSAKYNELVISLINTIKNDGPCKILVYHERVRVTGVLLIREILHENGMIDENEEPSDYTLCAICAETRISHSEPIESTDTSTGHRFRPLRYTCLYSELDKSLITSIRERFNSPANLHGEWCSILIGSKLIRESYDFKAMQHLYVMSLPVSISQLIQVMGRCIRRASHLQLPEDKRQVSVHIIVNASGVKEETNDGVSSYLVSAPNESPEVRRYALKLRTHLTVQQIEREMARHAIDAGINRNAITHVEKDDLGLLAFTEAIKFTLPDAKNPLIVDTFFAYGYGQQEIRLVIEIIRKLFKIQSIWYARDLVASVIKPPFHVPTYPAFIDQSSILLAISFLVSHSLSGAYLSSMTDRAIMINGVNYLIVAATTHAVKMEQLNACVQLDDLFNADDYFFLAPIESVEVAGIVKARPLIDIETFIRGPHYEPEMIVSINQYELQTSFEENIVPILREKYSRDDKNIARKPQAGAMIAMRSFLVELSSDQQRNVVRHFVEDKKFRAEFFTLYSFLHSLGVFVPYEYAKKYRDVARRFKWNKEPEADEPVAYGDGAAIYLYTGDEWISLGRSALNMHIEFNENNVLVGIYRQFPYNIKFQLREPIQKIRHSHQQSGQKMDARLVERGSVCTTRARSIVEHDAQRLGLYMRDIRAAKTTADLCDLIQKELLHKEIAARAVKHGIESLDKYIYGWWNVIPSPI